MTPPRTETSARRLLTEEVAVGEAIVRVLIEAGVDKVFGIAGGDTAPTIYAALRNHQSEIRTVLVREESLAGVMAEVYGRLTGKPGVVVAQGIWVLANAAMGTLEAHLSASPMVLLGDFTDGGNLSSHAPYQCGTGDYGSWDFRQAMKALTKQTFVPNSPAQGVQDVQLAIKHSLAGDPGPCAVLFASSVLAGTVGPLTSPALYTTESYLQSSRQPANAADVAKAATILAEAKNPVIVAGNGVRSSNAYLELLRLCEILPALVTTTAAGKSALPETHKYALGVFGNFGQASANAALAEADVVLAVGTRLGPTDTANENPDLLDPTRQRIIQIDIDPRNVSWTFPCESTLVGDAKEVLGQLLAILESRAPAPRTADSLQQRLSRLRENQVDEADPQETSDVGRLLPRAIIRQLNTAVADNALISCDAGENRIFMTHDFVTRSSGSFIQSSGIGAMGYAIPAALAAKLAHPDRQSVAVAGDGGFAMTMNGLMTAVEENIPITVVVFNNAALGWLKHEQAEAAGEFKCDFTDFDHAAIARAMGCDGVRVETHEELEVALRESLDSGRPTVIDVKTSLRESFRRVTSPLVEVHM